LPLSLRRWWLGSSVGGGTGANYGC